VPLPSDPPVRAQAIDSALAAHRARLLPKRGSPLMSIIAALLRPLGLREFMARYWTTLGRVIYYPTAVEDPRAYPQVIEHELVHVRQWARWGPWLWLSYLLLPLPFGLAWFRWRWEREAYLPEVLSASSAAERERVIQQLSETLWRGYGWPWPRRWMRSWFRAAAVRAAARNPGINF
jgi:hypothetical protein